MSKYKFLRIITRGLAATTFFALISCQNILNEVKDTEAKIQKARLLVTASATTVSRAAIDPQLKLSDFSDFKLYASTSDLPENPESLTPIAKGTTLEELNEPAIELDAGLWNFALTASLDGVKFSGTNTKFEVSPNSTNSITFTLTPEIDGGGLEIKISFPTSADKVQIRLEPAAGGTAIFDEYLTASSADYPIVTNEGKNSITFTRDITNPSERIAPGAYNLLYYFYDSGLPDYLNYCEFTVNIAAGVTTRENKLNISNLNDVYTITYSFKYHTYNGSTSVEQTITEDELLAQNTSLVLPKKYFRRSNIELPLLNNYRVSDDSVMSFAGWYDNPEGSTRRIYSFPETDSDVTLYGIFTDTLYVDTSKTDSLVTGFSPSYPCYKLSKAISSIEDINNLKTDTSADSNVDWKIVIDGQDEGASISRIAGKSLALQGKTNSTTDILDGGYEDLADMQNIVNISPVLDIKTGFPVTISKLTITHGGRGIAVSPGGNTGNLQTTLSLKSDTKIVSNIGADSAGGIYLYGNSSNKTILNIEEGVEISNNISRSNDSMQGYGGGIGAERYAIINMSGGQISSNTADNYGGGIYLGTGSTLNITGGTISGNTANEKGGAIYKASGATINLEGESYIPYTDNKNDIYLAGGAISLTGEIDYLNATDPNQVYGITIPDPSSTTTVLTEEEGNKNIEGYYSKFVPTVAGYTINSSGEWTAGATNYTVHHWKQNIDDDEYTEVTEHTVVLQGTTGSDTEAEARGYTGFTAKTFSQEPINADGSTVINIYYDRNIHNVTYTDGKDKITPAELIPSSDIEGSIPSQESLRYGAIGYVQVSLKPSLKGYTFAGWMKDDTVYTESSPLNFTMGDEDIEIYAVWEPASDTEYKVHHMKQNIDNDDYTLADTITESGRTGNMTNASDKTYNGFTVLGPVTQGIIGPDGDTIIEIKYNRNTYTVSYDANALSAETITVPSDTTQYRYQAPVTVKFTGIGSRTGYTFAGWAASSTATSADYTSSGTTSFDMTDNNVTLYAVWEVENQNTGIDASFGVDASTVEVSQSGSTFTATSGYDSYSWTVDGTAQTSTTNVLDLSSITVSGVYDITLTATKTVSGSTVTHTWTGQYIKS